MMENTNYRLAGIASILSAFLFIPVMGLLVLHDQQMHTALPDVGMNALLMIVITLDAVSKVLMIYALLQFRDLLNRRYDFHGVDVLIPVLIGVGIMTGVISYLARIFGSPIPSMVAGAFSAVAIGILGIVYARRLLRMNGNLNGYLKPLAYTILAGSICFLCLILAPIGLMLFRAADVILGLAFFKGQEMEELQVV